MLLIILDEILCKNTFISITDSRIELWKRQIVALRKFSAASYQIKREGECLLSTQTQANAHCLLHYHIIINIFIRIGGKRLQEWSTVSDRYSSVAEIVWGTVVWIRRNKKRSIQVEKPFFESTIKVSSLILLFHSQKGSVQALEK